MARPIRPAPVAPNTPGTHAPASATSTPSAAPGPAPVPAAVPTRSSHRVHRPSASTSAASTGAAYTPGPPTPGSDGAGVGGRHSARAGAAVEHKAHGLRSVGGASERTPCPFPAQWGGRVKVGITEEDEGDEALMSICAAIASHNNRALSADDIASTCFQQGWLRPPSAAIEPTTLINNTIRSYLKRCEKAKRHCLLAKYQLAGSVVESALESALHPNAFDGATRPKGTVWFLLSGPGAGAGKAKWKSPFDGLELPKVPPRKPAAPKKQKETRRAEKPAGTSAGKNDKGKDKAVGPVKIRLVLGGAGMQGEEDSSSERGRGSSSRSVSRGVSMSRQGSVASTPAEQPLPLQPKRTTAAPRRPKNIIDSSSESDSSDSDMDLDGEPSRRQVRLPLRKGPPPPLAIGGSPRVYSASRLPQHSPFMDVFFPTPQLPSLPPFAVPHTSPFPSHSLDNTTWTARHDRDSRHFETSSSSSDDEAFEPEWGVLSDVLIKESGEDEEKPLWSLEEDEAKVKEATDALRVLFPMSSPEEDAERDGNFELNKLDNRPSGTDSPSLSEPASVITSRGFMGKLKAVDAGGLPLNAWVANSSPAPSPNMRPFKSFGQPLPLPLDLSPTQHFSKLRGSFDPERMDVDEEPWLDESGELPVKAEDTFSDVDIGSTIDEAATPEHDRHLHTALWAQEAAATIRIKQEPEDYPSPATMDDDTSAFHCSRASSTPSYGSSDLPMCDSEDNGMGVDEVILGPESVSVEELDGWLPPGKSERTPYRGGRGGKAKREREKGDGPRCSGVWGGIGVCSSVGEGFKSPTRTRSTRSTATSATASCMRRRKSKSSQCPTIGADIPERLLTPESDLGAGADDEVDDAIGTEDLELARVEADAREEQHRKACKEKAEQHRAMLEAYRQTVRGEIGDQTDSSASPWEGAQGHAPWGSSDSLHIATPGALSPMVLHSVSNLSLSAPIGDMMMAVDPKSLVSPPLHAGFGQLPMSGSTAAASEMGMSLGAGMLDGALSQQEVDAIMEESAAHVLTPPPTVVADPSSPLTQPPAFQSTVAVSPVSLPAAPVSTQATPIHIAMASTQNDKAPAMVALPTLLPAQTAQPASTPSPVAAPSSAALAPPASVDVPRNSASPKLAPAPASSAPTPRAITPSGTAPSTSTASSHSSSGAPCTAATPSSTASSSTSANGGSKAKSGGKIATITKPLCPGVDACVVDNIPVYAHLFDGKDGSGKQVLLRRLDTDFVNANALLHALDVPLPKHAEYLDNPISQLRLAARHIVPPSNSGVEYSQGVSGIWVHLSEAREFARRAKLAEGCLLASVLREDLFQLFATLAGLKPDHPPSESFGLPFVPRRHNPPASSLSSANSKSAPNLPALSTSAPANNHLRPTSSITAAAPKGPLVRSAPATPPDGCPQPKRRRATISSPLAKKVPGAPGVQPQAQAQVAGTGAVPGGQVVGATATRTSTAAQKRSTRASIGGAPARPNMGK
ncbi:hypothetical protein IAT38_000721 [Cryptococcus sp. DSM 104549]